jgi:hypothetical protein
VPAANTIGSRGSDINVVIVGGETQRAWKIFGANYVTTVPVDAWR